MRDFDDATAPTAIPPRAGRGMDAELPIAVLYGCGDLNKTAGHSRPVWDLDSVLSAGSN